MATHRCTLTWDETLAMEQIGPKFPVTLVEKLPSFVPWKREATFRTTIYLSEEDLEGDLEWTDTRTLKGTYLRDNCGRIWDVSVDIMSPKRHKTEYFLRPEGAEE